MFANVPSLRESAGRVAAVIATACALGGIAAGATACGNDGLPRFANPLPYDAGAERDAGSDSAAPDEDAGMP